MVLKAPQRYAISVGDVRVVRVNFTDDLDDEISLTGTPTVTASSSVLTINTSGAVVNTTSYTDYNTGNVVGVGKAVKFVVSAGTASQSPYDITVTAQTDGTPAETIKKIVTLSFV